MDDQSILERDVSRRQLLKLAALAAGSIPTVGAILAACGQNPAASSSAASAAATTAASGAGSSSAAASAGAGEIFDAQGATLNIGNWGGFWSDTQHKASIDKFEKDFNCKTNYDSAAPFYPKMAISGVDNPVLDVYSFDQDTQYNNEPFIFPADAVAANCPNTADLWPFWRTASTGTVWCYDEIGFVYRTDLVKPAPTSFKDIFSDRFAGKRGHYIAENGVGARTLLVANKAFGSGLTDGDAGIGALEKAAPWKVSDFTGNMMALVERGEVVIATIDAGEAYAAKAKGLPIDFVPWNDVVKPLIPQQFGVARGTKNPRLAFAFLNRMLSPEVELVWAQDVFQRPANKKVVLPPAMTSAGIKNTEEGIKGLDGLTDGWKWWFENERTIVERLNKVFTKNTA